MPFSDIEAAKATFIADIRSEMDGFFVMVKGNYRDRNDLDDSFNRMSLRLEQVKRVWEPATKGAYKTLGIFVIAEYAGIQIRLDGELIWSGSLQ